MIKVIASQELKILFRSPLAWVILGVMQIVFAWLFLSALEHYLVLQPKLSLNENNPGASSYLISQFMAPAAIVILLISPLLTMRTLAEESRAKSLILLQAAPINISSIVLGKFIGALSLQLVLLILAFIMPTSLMLFTHMDIGSISAAFIGLFLFSNATTAISLYFSSLTQQPMIAAFSSFATLLFLWLLGSGSYSNEMISAVLLNLSLPQHLNNFFKGLINSHDFVYFGLISFLFLSMTMLRLDANRFKEAR